MRNNAKTIILPLAAMCVVFLIAPPGIPQEPQRPDAQQPGPGEDPIQQLNLTAEQREKIRVITEDRKLERVEINQRLREANRGLQETLDSDNPDEAVVEQRLRDVATAQAAQMRMRVLTEVRIRRVLSPGQQGLLRILRRQAKRERQLDKLNGNRRQLARPGTLTNRRNGLGPLSPRQGGAQRRQLP
jgi:Spy/CpxP family protein refolding chaperone